MMITVPIWQFFLIWLALRLLVWWIQKYLEPRMKTRAELSGREDKLDTILNEVRHVTHVQKEIESKITGRDWNRQRAYELRRDTYISLIGILGSLAIATREMMRLGINHEHQPFDPKTEEYGKVRDEADSLIYKLNSERFLHRALLGERVYERLEQAKVDIRTTIPKSS